MFWILLSLLAGAAKTGKSLTTKYATGIASQYTVAFSIRAVTALAVAIPAALTWTVTTDSTLWIALAANTIALGAATVTSTRAFKYGDVSIVAPLIGLAPLAILVPSVLVFGDTPTPTAVVGIGLVALGGYTLELDDVRSDFFKPVKALASSRGARYALLTILIVMFVPNLDEIGIQRTNPYVWTFLLHVTTSAVIAPLLLRAGQQDARYSPRWGSLFSVSVSRTPQFSFSSQSHTSSPSQSMLFP